MLLATADTRISTIAKRQHVAVDAAMDREEIAHIFAAYDLLALPVVMSACLGAMVPLLFKAFGIDPAVASGPLITTVNDVLSLVIYFGIATILARELL